MERFTEPSASLKYTDACQTLDFMSVKAQCPLLLPSHSGVPCNSPGAQIPSGVCNTVCTTSNAFNK